MELRELRYFIEIAKEKNITRASEKLFISQPALSKAIKKLEAELNIPLFVMRSNGVFLTDYGEALMKKAVPLINEFDSLKDYVQDLNGMGRGILRIGLTPMIGTLYMVDMLTNFCDMHPEIQLKINENGSKELRRELIAGELDLVICLSDEHCDKISETVLLKDEMTVCVHKKHILAKEESISFGQLEGEPLNLYGASATLNEQIRNRCIGFGFEPTMNMISSKVHMLIKMTAHGRGVCILPRPWAERENTSELRILHLKEAFPWVCCIIKKTGSYQTHASRLFEKHIVDSFKEIAGVSDSNI